MTSHLISDVFTNEELVLILKGKELMNFPKPGDVVDMYTILEDGQKMARFYTYTTIKIEYASGNHQFAAKWWEEYDYLTQRYQALLKGELADILENCMQDILNPTWSSQLIVDLFNRLDGDMRDKMQVILPIIDDRLSSIEHSLTDTQFYFIKEIGLQYFVAKQRIEFDNISLSWLLKRFLSHPTPQRAIMLAILLKPSFLVDEVKIQIKQLLKGSIIEDIQLED